MVGKPLQVLYEEIRWIHPWLLSAVDKELFLALFYHLSCLSHILERFQDGHRFAKLAVRIFQIGQDGGSRFLSIGALDVTAEQGFLQDRLQLLLWRCRRRLSQDGHHFFWETLQTEPNLQAPVWLARCMADWLIDWSACTRSRDRSFPVAAVVDSFPANSQYRLPMTTIFISILLNSAVFTQQTNIGCKLLQLVN